MVTVFVRTLIIYILLLVSVRLVGKRQIGELQISELITTLMLSELAVLPISDTDIPLSYAIVPILTLLSLEVIVSFCASRHTSLRKLLFGTPSILIYRGRMNVEEMKKLRIGVGELMAELRVKDVADISDVRCAILEDNGKLAVFTKAERNPVTAREAHVEVEEPGVSLPILINGRILRTSMAHAAVDEAWIDRTLKNVGYKRHEILLMSVDECGKATFVAKNSADGQIVEVEA